MQSKQKFQPNPKAKLLDQVREVLRYHHYAYRTEKTYCDWIRRYVKFHGPKRHPRDMGKAEIEAFLSDLATRGQVAAATQKQAMNAILFLYSHVLDRPLTDKVAPIRSRRAPKLPVVMTRGEVTTVLAQMQGNPLLMARLLYGGGLRVMECMRLRVKDLDFEIGKIYVRAGKGGKDRVTLFPRFLHEELHVHLRKVRTLHEQDLAQGHGEVDLPGALARKYKSAAHEFGWQYLFPAKELSLDPRSNSKRRHHVLESGLQKAVKRAVRKTGFAKHITCHTFRHSFATHLLENGVNIYIVQDLMGHADVKTTEIYTHVMDKRLDEVRSPLDVLMAAAQPPAEAGSSGK